MGERMIYCPGPDQSWERRRPEDLGMRSDGLHEAVAHAASSETSWPRDLSKVITQIDKPPHNELLGPTRERAGVGGLVLRHGYIVAEWGDLDRADMTFSATKSYLSTVAGLAWDRGLIRDPHDLISDYVDDGGFEPPHNSKITWHHMLQQTSEWEGTLFDLPDLVDRNRVLGREDNPEKGTHRELQEPGSFWEYNDVRVNRLALSLLRVWGEPLPGVLKREIMDPIGASGTWEWHGYRNSRVDVNGVQMQSVPGGGHWGGGLFISTLDHARFGYLLMCHGRWGDRQIISRAWIERAMAPCEQNPGYGYMWWLNTECELYPAAPKRSFAARGAGGNVVAIDPENDLVVVTRWTDDVQGVIQRIYAAME